MKVLVACEFSGVVREAFKEKGHDAWSCDLLDTEISGQHIKGDVLKVLDQGWDMLIAFPPCTYLTASNAQRWEKYAQEQNDALAFVAALMNADIDKVAVENPVGVISTRIQKPTQIIQPYMFGHSEMKTTCLWLWGLPKLIPTNRVPLPKAMNQKHRIHYVGESRKRSLDRSRTYNGIAKAMADQWG